MSNLSFDEKRKLEKLFGMNSGYVLNFTDRTFRNFLYDHVQRDISDILYHKQGTSKANRFRCFWDIEDNHIVGKVIEAMILYGQEEKCLCDELVLLADCQKIAARLLNNSSVVNLSALTNTVNEADFEIIKEHIRVAIEKHQPEGALDRLHTYVIKYIRRLFKLRGIEVNREKPLHSIFGEYIKYLRDNNHIKSEMTVRILKSRISVLEAFNNVRNEKSLAHDNPLLDYDESILIFNDIANLVEFIEAIESRIKNTLIASNVNW